MFIPATFFYVLAAVFVVVPILDALTGAFLAAITAGPQRKRSAIGPAVFELIAVGTALKAVVGANGIGDSSRAPRHQPVLRRCRLALAAGGSVMNSYVLRSLIRAAAFRVMRRAPLWVVLCVLTVGFVLEHGGR